jgi:hypothetical protein
MSKFIQDPPRRVPQAAPSQTVQSSSKTTYSETVTETPQRASTAWIVVIIIVIIIILILIALLIWALTTRSTTTTTGCQTAPPAPTNVNASYNAASDTTIVTWTIVTDPNVEDNVVTYTIYRSQNDATVSKTNFDQKVDRPAISSTGEVNPLIVTFANLPIGTQYFAVTAANACGESALSNVDSIVVGCAEIVPKPPAPTISTDANACLTPAAVEFIEINVANANLVDGGYIVRGTGQSGAVENYLSVLPQSSFGPISGVTQKCNGGVSTHNVINVSKWSEAVVTSALPAVTSNTYQVTWTALPEVDEYVVWFVGSGGNLFYFYGGFAAGNTTSLNLPVTNGLVGFYVAVLGYKLCDKSDQSNDAVHNKVAPV